MDGRLIKDIAKKLYPFDYSITGEGSREAVDAFREFADFDIHTYASGKELRGWRIPVGWRAKKALVLHKGEVWYDCLKSTPLGCAYLSPSFSGRVTKEELLNHCAWREDQPDAIVYDWTRLYRQNEQTKWGLSIPWNVFTEAPEAELEVEIETEQYESTMYVLDLKIQGQVDDEILISAHNCHPFQANDDISGCATALALFKYSLSVRENYFTYRLLIGPELFAPLFWLEEFAENAKLIKSVVLLKSVGNDAQMKIQNSFTGTHTIDQIAKAAAEECTEDESPIPFHQFRSYYGNDETVFEAPGFEIPTITLTRFPFPEYHTDLDTPDKLNTQRLAHSYRLLHAIVDIVETNKYASAVETGLFCLSHPSFNLYRSAPEPGISSRGNSAMEKKWNLLMNCLSRELSSGLSILEISLKYKINYSLLREYVNEWESCGIVRLSRSLDL